MRRQNCTEDEDKQNRRDRRTLSSLNDEQNGRNRGRPSTLSDEQKVTHTARMRDIITALGHFHFLPTFFLQPGALTTADGRKERARRVELAGMGKSSLFKNRVPLQNNFTVEDRELSPKELGPFT